MNFNEQAEKTRKKLQRIVNEQNIPHLFVGSIAGLSGNTISRFLKGNQSIAGPTLDAIQKAIDSGKLIKPEEKQAPLPFAPATPLAHVGQGAQHTWLLGRIADALEGIKKSLSSIEEMQCSFPSTTGIFESKEDGLDG